MDKNLPTRALLSVSDLTTRARQLLESEMAHLWVAGEIAQLTRPASGHWYFTLKDDRAQVRCVMFRQSSLQVRPPAQGDEVLVCGRISLYEPRGDFQMIVSVLEHQGTGLLFRQFEALKAKLQAEGLFDESRKRPLPAYPACIGLLTSATGAALHDMLSVASQAALGVQLLLYPCAVQGEAAAAEIRAALALANRHARADVILLGRGGGSYEDMFCFNDEQLARDIVASAIPVVSAVGHEIDFTIADFVADRRAPTPTAAMQLALRQTLELGQLLRKEQRHLQVLIEGYLQRRVERLAGLQRQLRSPQVRLDHQRQQLDQLEAQFGRAIARLLDRRSDRLAALTNHLRLASPRRRIADTGARLLASGRALELSMNQVLERCQFRLSNQVGLLQSASPLASLRRGYAILLNPDGLAVSSVKQAQPGELLRAQVRDGEIPLQVAGTDDS